MNHEDSDIVVVGLTCLDIIPKFISGRVPLQDLLVPGKLVEVGDAVVATGGATSNTGIALHRLGFKVSLVGKVGDDAFGQATLNIIKSQGEHLIQDMIVSPGEGSAYTVVISPPGIDRIFLHSPGASNTFKACDVPDSAFKSGKILHFGYPPLMRAFAIDNGRELKELFTRARDNGMITSLDMARPDPDGPSGTIDWAAYLEHVLPFTDVFVPSIDEIIYMTDPALFRRLLEEAGPGNPAAYPDIETIRGFADRMLAMGPAIVGFKLGNQGFYLKTADDRERLSAMGSRSPVDPDMWRGAELITPCRQVKVAGTLGAGDCTIAGFLGALLRGLPPDAAVAMAVATGASGVEEMDAFSGVPAWEIVQERLDAGWPELPSRTIPENWIRTPGGNRCRRG